MTTLAIDQYGNHHKIKGVYPRKELLELFGVKSCKKMYRDTIEGETVHVGYIISGLWIELFKLENWR